MSKNIKATMPSDGRKNEFKVLPLSHFKNCLGKSIIKIGVDPHCNTCRAVLDDGSVLFIQSHVDKNLLLQHGLSCHVITVDDEGEAHAIGSSPHIEWFFK